MAGRFFKKIQEAYQVLNDPRLRAVYDMRGRKGMQDDRAIIERTALPKELLEEYEKLKALFEERTFIQEINPRGLFQIHIDATRLVMGSSNGRPLIFAKNVYVQQSVDASLAKPTLATLTGTVYTSQNALFTGLQGAVQQQLGNQNWVKLTTLAGAHPSVGLDFYHNLTDKMYMMSENILQVLPQGVGMSLNGRLARKLDNKTTAVLKVLNSGNSVGVSITRQVSEKVQVLGDIVVGQKDSYLQVATKLKPKENYLVSGGIRMAISGPSVSYGVEHTLTKLTHVGARVMVSGRKGVELKLRFTRASMNFNFNIHLSPVFHLPAMFYATVLPVFLFGCFKVLALAPALHHQRQQEMEERKAEREREMRERRREAESAIDLMRETVERVITTENSRHGLIIVEAWYGCLFSAGTAPDPLAPPRVIDVRIPLQCLVTDSKLMLRESSKSVIPGFYDPCIGEKKYLRVRYEFRGFLHEVTVENSEPLMIPRQSHKIV